MRSVINSLRNQTSYISISLGVLSFLHPNYDKSCENNEESKSYPIYTRDEISKHKTPSNRIWVTYGDGVYDITDWIANHPGGQEKIMLAAGSSVEPYWKVYQQHYNSQLPLQILASMKCGILHPDDLKSETLASDKNDPYSSDPVPSPILIYHQKKPLNAEPPTSILSDNYITPNDLWFIRNHHPVPSLDQSNHMVDVQGDFLGDSKITFNMSDLKSKFPKHTITSSIQCGGNRRREMNKQNITAGSPWDVCAISTATWSGAKLSEVLEALGVTKDLIKKHGYKHVQFQSVDGLEASIPIRKAMDEEGDTLLAYEMNGTEIPPTHGYPLRLVAPGHVGVRSVKWLTKIILSAEEADGPWQRGMAYKGFPPSLKSLDGIDTAKLVSLQEQPVQSAVLHPQNGSTLHGGMSNTIKGYAYSGGGRGILRVDVSIDGGKSWQTASLTEGSEQPLDKAWAWTFWELDLDVPDMAASEIEIICKAVDASHNVQPESIGGIWNLRGINNNSWHRVKCLVD